MQKVFFNRMVRLKLGLLDQKYLSDLLNVSFATHVPICFASAVYCESFSLRLGTRLDVTNGQLYSAMYSKINQ